MEDEDMNHTVKYRLCLD